MFLLVQFMMQIKFNFNNFIFFGQSATAWPSSLAVVIGLSNNDVISLRSLRFLRCVHFRSRSRRASRRHCALYL